MRILLHRLEVSGRLHWAQLLNEVLGDLFLTVTHVRFGHDGLRHQVGGCQRIRPQTPLPE